MAYDTYLADRIRVILQHKRIRFEAKEMMGGLCFMVDQKMCLGIVKNKLMARVGPEQYAEALRQEGCHPMDFTGRPMKGFVYVSPAAIDFDDDLTRWVDRCLAYNPHAKKRKS